MVVWHHYMQAFHLFDASSAIGAFFVHHGGFGVDLFFVLSGFVMFQSTAPGRCTVLGFLTNRLFRIAPAYWVATLVTVMCIIAMPAVFSPENFSLKKVLCSLIWVPVWNPTMTMLYPVHMVGWTLQLEMFYYLILGLCLWLSPLCGRYWGMLLLFLLPYFSIPGTYASVATSPYLREFLAGMLIALALTTPLARGGLKTRSLLLLAIIVICGVMHGFELRYGISIRFISMMKASQCICAALLLEPFLNRENWFIRGLVQLGDESYSTYLFHTIVINLMLQITGRRAGLAWELLNIVCIAIVTWIVSKVLYRHLERNAGIHKLQQLVLTKVGGSRRAN